MKTSSEGLAAIELREGKRLQAYRDTVGVWTIGVGHTGRMAGAPVTRGMSITDAQCRAFLAADVAPVEIAINRALKVPVSQNEFDAMVSLWFNAGTGYVASSSIIKRLNLGDVAGAAAGFDAYHKPSGIIGRRNGEKAQFLSSEGTAVPARGAVLATMAGKAKAVSKRATAGTVAAGTAGAAIVAGAASTGSHGLIASLVALLTAASVGALGFTAWKGTAKAATLSSNATSHLGA